MPDIIIKNTESSFEYSPGKNLLEILVENNIFIDNPCNGKGSCGKCKVKILDGEISKPSETELKFLNENELSEGIRLSCLINPTSNITVETLQVERKHKILTTGYTPKFEFSPSITKKVFEIETPSLQNQTPFEDSIVNALSLDSIDISVLENTPPFYGKATGVFSNNTLIAIENQDTSDLIYGVAIDIGTTTVVASLVNMINGKEIASASIINPQKKFGLDVLTRITYALDNPETSTKNLQYEIVNGINEMILEICSKSGVNKSNIYEISIAANCTMLHFLLGVDSSSIGRSPFAPAFVKSKNVPASSIGINVNSACRLYCLPSVSAYIGADIVAGAYVCELHKAEDNVLFIDIGTNGEIVLSNKGRLLSCSCAAGPALEGMNISCGMRAADGAIEDVEILEDEVSVKIIGDQPPVGICGSGILAVIRELLKTGIVKKDGSFIKKDTIPEDDYRQKYIQLNGRKREFILSESPEPLYITQSDVRQVQLAKGAILSGFYALLNKSGLSMDQLDKVVIAGQFGSHLPAESLTGTGILPSEVNDKLVYVGNSSKTGAYMALMSKDVKSELEEIAHNIDYMELGASEGYEKLFASCLMF